jgi:hypothetical protein
MQSGSESARISHGFVRTAFGSRLRSERFQQSRDASLKKLSPVLGYLVMVAAIAFALSQFF